MDVSEELAVSIIKVKGVYLLVEAVTTIRVLLRQGLALLCH
jgi:hypothetical protein